MLGGSLVGFVAQIWMLYEVQSPAAKRWKKKKKNGNVGYICADIVHLGSTTCCTEGWIVCFNLAQLQLIATQKAVHPAPACNVTIVRPSPTWAVLSNLAIWRFWSVFWWMQCCTHTCSVEHSLSAVWGVFSFLFLQFAIPCAKQSPSAGQASVVCQIILFLLVTYFSFLFNSSCCNSCTFVFFTCCNLDIGWVQKPVSHATSPVLAAITHFLRLWPWCIVQACIHCWGEWQLVRRCMLGSCKCRRNVLLSCALCKTN